MRFRLLAALTVAMHVDAGATHGQQSAPDSVRVQRLAAVGRLWGIVRYFHPAFLYRNVPWDSAVVAAIPRIRAAQNRAEYVSALDAMLGVLGDANTRMLGPEPVTVDEPTLRHGTTLTTQWQRDSTLVVRIPCCFQEQFQKLQQAAALIERARRVVFDLRGPPPGIRGEAADEFVERIDALLAHGDIAFPTTRRRIYRRFGENRVSDGSGSVYRGRPGNLPRTTAFLVYADSDLPSIAWALRKAGHGYVVLDDARGSRLVPDPALSDPPLFPVDLGEGLTAEVRVVDMLGEPNGLLGPDTVITKTGTADEPLDAALALVRESPAARTRQASVTVLPQREDVYPASRFPDVGYRILAGFKYWNAVHYFYPSAMPPGTRWGDVLGETVRNLEQARDTLEYWLAIAAMTTRLADGHASAGAPIGPHVAGRAGPRLLLGYIEEQVVVTRVMPDSATASSGIRVGDVILRVDGEPVGSRMSRIQRVMPGNSRPGEPNGPPLNQLLFGNPGTVARLSVDRGDGVVRDVAVPRAMPPCLPQSCAERDGPAIRFLAPDIGYADLYAITESMVDSVFETFKNTRAIVFDGRGRNVGAPPAIAARLADRSRFEAGHTRRPFVLSPDFNVRANSESRLFLEGAAKGRYRGKTVLLINNRAFSNAEQVALFFTGANGTTLIGSPTGGGIGGITSVPLPGGIAPTFPGSEALLRDGRSMVRIGIPPDILVRPTIAGVRAGRDEALERALAFLSSR